MEVRRVVLGGWGRGVLRRGERLRGWAGAGGTGDARMEGRRRDADRRRGYIVLVILSG